jgi:hypothetical protein
MKRTVCNLILLFLFPAVGFAQAAGKPVARQSAKPQSTEISMTGQTFFDRLSACLRCKATDD